MLQRIQTIYLVAAFALLMGCLCLPLADFVSQESFDSMRMYNLWLVSQEGQHLFYFCPVLMGILAASATAVFADIWLFRNRQLQMRVCTFSMILIVAWYASLAAIVYMLTDAEPMAWRLRMAASLPLVSLILLWLAHRGIAKDERLVRSLDRLR